MKQLREVLANKSTGAKNKNKLAFSKMLDEKFANHYAQVLYGHVKAFKRLPNNESEGTFFVSFKATEQTFKLKDSQIYGQEEQMLLRSLIVEPGDAPVRGVIMVLDGDGYVSLVRNTL